MKGWGRACFMVAGGVFLAAGCGGRTSTLSDGFGPDGSGADGVGATSHTGGTSSTGARPSRAGAANVGGFGTAGTVSVGGGYPGGAPVGGGYGYGGAYGYAGAYGSGGAFPGGGAYGGGFPVGGYGGYPVQPGGACCDPQMGPSCRPTSVAKCVCGAAPYCCDKQWDAGCASLVEQLGCGYCEPVDCNSCLNQYCGAELSSCFGDFGCLAIFSCMQARGCEPFECYQPGQCGDTIDQWGGPAGGSMNLLLQAFSCAVRSGCPCN